MSRDDDIAHEMTLAEAAAWVVRLHREERDADTEAALQHWLQHPVHASAFARATWAWEIIPGAARFGERVSDTAVSKRLFPARRRLHSALSAAALTIAILAGSAYLARDPVYTTKAGEQETVTLSDGTLVSLNTNTKVVVDYTRNLRRVRLERGEAMFEVSKNPRRPFVVQAAREEVGALGTTFTVRKDPGRLSVLLVEGRVQISRHARQRSKSVRLAILAPGERMTVRADGAPVVDYPSVEMATAWRRGEIIFDNTAIVDALAEFNRYGPPYIRIGNPALAKLHISGVFRTHEAYEFARTIGELYRLRLEQHDETLILDSANSVQYSFVPRR